MPSNVTDYLFAWMAALPFSRSRHFTIPLFFLWDSGGAKMSIHNAKLLLTLKTVISAMFLGRLKGTDTVLHSLYLNLSAPLQRVWKKYGLMMQSSGFWPESRALQGNRCLGAGLQQQSRAVLNKLLYVHPPRALNWWSRESDYTSLYSRWC